ncbi:MAG: glycosyltransferase [Chloroflexi bacterium]|nr:MAG: glycosyltransferase [Chloroflexota bacterium]
MTALHIVPAIDNEASGPSYSVRRLCEALIDAGVSTKLAVLDWGSAKEVPSYVERFPLGLGPRRLGRSPAMARWLVRQVECGVVDVLHNHGMWMIPNIYAGEARLKGEARLVVSPRGTVSQWAWNHHRGRKWLIWHFLGQGRVMRLADAFHVTGESECKDLRRLGFRQPVAIIPNGVDVPPFVKKPSGKEKILLYLGRVHKKKGIDFLLRAWSVMEPRYPQWRLVVAGPDDGGYLPQYKRLARELSLERVTFSGAVYGEQKLSLYRAAHLYVLPTRSENFAMTVAEALAAGTPAIVTKGAPWAGLEREGAGWWIESGVEPLVASLEKALGMAGERLAEMGFRGRKWMIREYSWEIIGKQMEAFYAWLCGRGPRPAYVREGCGEI